MAVLIVRTPGLEERVIPLEGERLVVGRGEACDIQVEDEAVAERHVRLRALEEGGWVAVDLGSMSGTQRIVRVRGEEKPSARPILRRGLVAGDVLRVGKTLLTYRDQAPASTDVPIVGGTLELRRITDEGARREAPAAPAAPPEPAPRPEPALSGAPASGSEEERPAYRPLDGRSFGRIVMFLVLCALGWAGVEVFLGSEASRSRDAADGRRALRTALQNMDVSFETFLEEATAILQEYPNLPERAELEAYLDAASATERDRARMESEFHAILLGRHDLPESERRGRMLELKRAFPDDENLQLKIALALAQLDAQHEARESQALEETLAAATDFVAQRNPAAALRRLAAFQKGWASVSSDARARLQEMEDRAIAAATRIEQEALAAANAETDDQKRRQILTDAWHGLAGMPQGVRVADALRFTRPAGVPGAPAGTTPAPGAQEPTLPPDILTRAAAAEKLASARDWAKARVAFAELLEGSEPGLLQSEWQARAEEIEKVLMLAAVLGEAARGDPLPEFRLSLGRVRVTAADEQGVTLVKGDDEQRLEWPGVPEEDLMPLLTPKRPTAEQRLGVALLAASLSRAEEMTAVLIPLFESGEAVDEASRLVARYLYGKAAPPSGGYLVYKGEILDRATYERRLRDERIAQLRIDVQAAFEKVIADAAFNKLEKLRRLRDELDERRRASLVAIFNETHYPYPYNRGGKPYRVVQNEIDARTERIREIWDDPLRVKISRKGTLARALDAWDTIIAELERLDVDVSKYRAEMEPYTAYVTGEPITIREYFRNEAERKLFAYNRWVMETYNPAQREVARESEIEQTRVTNEYRMMMGFAANVKPGAAPYDALDEETVAKILDEGRILSVVPLRAVRIDDRLVVAARLHSEDMVKRGYFSHHAKQPGAPNGVTPFDRMRNAGYSGGGASENIQNGAASPEGAHQRWIHSSGHHRNILSPWSDQGVGQAGRMWTQNFGSGGGRPPVIEEPPAEAGDAGSSER
ncbi:MAG: CAP domain-containing protein [Planctomycetota bacterium]|jgi:uncharacterized protein YkwD